MTAAWARRFWPLVKNAHTARGTIVLLLSVHAGLLAWTGYRNSPTLDEVAHLPAGLSHWQFGTFDLYNVNPPLVRTLAVVPLLFVEPKTDWSDYNPEPLSRSEFSIGRGFMRANGGSAFWYFTLARWACIPLSLVGGYICYRWARELYGVPAGLMALVLWCFSPNVLGHAAMITPDAGAAALGVLAAYLFWRWLRRLDWSAALAAAFGLGLAELAKTTWIVLFVVWPALWLFQAATTRPSLSPRLWRRQGAQLACILVLSAYIINLNYGFEDSCMRLKEFEFVSHALNGKSEPDAVGNRFAGTVLGEVPVPLPRNYVRGIDVQRADFERKKWSYLCGEHRFGGWWYYYLYALGVKTPVGTLACGVLVLFAVIGGWRKEHRWQDDLVVLVPFCAILVLVSSQTGFNRYVRYVLPAVPFALVWVSQLAATPRIWQRWLAAALVASSTVSSLRIAPHSLSYFNELAGGPLGGPVHLLDANIDWGQDLLNLKRWLDAHPQAHPLYLAYFGSVDPQTAGIEFKPVPPGPVPERDGAAAWNTFAPPPGWYAVSVNHLYGYKHFENDLPIYTYFQRFTPVARAGYSIMIFRILEDESS